MEIGSQIGMFEINGNYDFDIERRSDIALTDKVKKIISDFDIKIENSYEHFTGSLNIPDDNWNIGLIVGRSGTGKSTIARELFGEHYVNGYQYNNQSVIDDMPCDDVSKIELVFTSVGFSSPPSWLKPYSVLSTGEKMRADLARAILSEDEIIAFDEFTSVVGRDVAKTCSDAIQKFIRKENKKFVAITCHTDVEEYLMPDWIYDTDRKSFFGLVASMSATKEKLTYTKLPDLIKTKYGKYLGSITI